VSEPRSSRIRKLAKDRDVAGLIEALGSRVGLECLEARDVLVELGGDEVANGLLDALEHRERHIASVAGQALAWMGDRRAVEPLLRLLTDFDLDSPPGEAWWNWGLVVDAVGVLKMREAVDPLIAALAVADDDMRQDIAASLGDIGDPRAVPGLIPLLDPQSFPTDEWVAEALERIGGPEAERAVAEWKPKHEAWLNEP
jgi:HEAT repeat protein